MSRRRRSVIRIALSSSPVSLPKMRTIAAGPTEPRLLALQLGHHGVRRREPAALPLALAGGSAPVRTRSARSRPHSSTCDSSRWISPCTASGTATPEPELAGDADPALVEGERQAPLRAVEPVDLDQRGRLVSSTSSTSMQDSSTRGAWPWTDTHTTCSLGGQREVTVVVPLPAPRRRSSATARSMTARTSSTEDGLDHPIGSDAGSRLGSRGLRLEAVGVRGRIGCSTPCVSRSASTTITAARSTCRGSSWTAEIELAVREHLHPQNTASQRHLAPRRGCIRRVGVDHDAVVDLQHRQPVSQPLAELPPGRLHRVVPPTLQLVVHRFDPTSGSPPRSPQGRL